MKEDLPSLLADDIGGAMVMAGILIENHFALVFCQHRVISFCGDANQGESRNGSMPKAQGRESNPLFFCSI